MPEIKRLEAFGLVGAFNQLQIQINEIKENETMQIEALQKQIHDMPKPINGKDGLDGKDADIKALQLQNDINAKIAEQIKKLSDDINNLLEHIKRHHTRLYDLEHKKAWWRFW